eukprot:15326135-Alexandrium_andersonii.AAC.1
MRQQLVEGEFNSPASEDPSMRDGSVQRRELDLLRARLGLEPFEYRSSRAADAYSQAGVPLHVGQSLQVGADQVEEERQWIEQ